MLRSCYSLETENHYKKWRPRTFAAREFNRERNWIHLLINIIRHGIRKKEITPDRKIAIITFNYDQVLEYVLEKQFSNTEANYPHYSNFVEILHVHGSLCPLENEPHAFAAMALACGKGINVVNEPTVPPEIKQVRDRAKAIIKEAREIYSAGFSFAGPNRKLLGLEEIAAASRSKKYIRYCNYDGNVGVKRSAEACASQERRVVVEEAAGTIDRPLSVTDWLKSGHLGELPG